MTPALPGSRDCSLAHRGAKADRTDLAERPYTPWQGGQWSGEGGLAGPPRSPRHRHAAGRRRPGARRRWCRPRLKRGRRLPVVSWPGGWERGRQAGRIDRTQVFDRRAILLWLGREGRLDWPLAPTWAHRGRPPRPRRSHGLGPSPNARRATAHRSRAAISSPGGLNSGTDFRAESGQNYVELSCRVAAP